MARKKDLEDLTEVLKSESARVSDEDWPAFRESAKTTLIAQIAGYTDRACIPYLERMYNGKLRRPSSKTGEAFFDFESPHKHIFLKNLLPTLKIVTGMHSKMELQLISDVRKLKRKVPPLYHNWEEFSSDRGHLSWHCIVGQMGGFPNYVAGVELFKIIDSSKDSTFDKTEIRRYFQPGEECGDWGCDVYWRVGRELHCSSNGWGKDEQDSTWQLREAVKQYKKNFPRELKYKGIEDKVRHWREIGS